MPPLSESPKLRSVSREVEAVGRIGWRIFDSLPPGGCTHVVQSPCGYRNFSASSEIGGTEPLEGYHRTESVAHYRGLAGLMGKTPPRMRGYGIRSDRGGVERCKAMNNNRHRFREEMRVEIEIRNGPRPLLR